MANDCKPRDRNTPEQDSLPLPAAPCPEGLLAAPQYSTDLESVVGEECCPNDNVERGWYNAKLTLSCDESSTGASVVIPYAQVHSTVSQEAADQAALELAETLLVCTWLSQEVTLDCADGSGTLTVPPGAFSSTVSQADADALAEQYGIDHLICCRQDDPLDYLFTGSSSVVSELVPVDVYGALGFTEQVDLGLPSTGYEKCSYLAFCHGPPSEGDTSVERYPQRWEARYDDGFFYYGPVNTELLPAPAALFPEGAIPEVVGISLAFDANARPVFGFELHGDLIELRRFVAGVYTNYSFAGSSPQLFYNGTVQRDSGQRDVVCYYIRAGSLMARFQRENFLVEYTLLSELPSEVTLHTDARYEDNSHYLIFRGETLAAVTVGYQPWPVFAREEGASPAYGVSTVEYDLLIKELGTYAEPGLAPAYGIDSIEYVSQIVNITGDTEVGAAPAYAVEGVEYPLVVITAGTYSESGETPSYGVEVVEYPLIAINAGTYAEAGSAPAYGVESITYE